MNCISKTDVTNFIYATRTKNESDFLEKIFCARKFIYLKIFVLNLKCK